MAIPLSSAVIAEKNKLSSDGVWLILLELKLDETTTVRLVRNTEDFVWNSYTWVAFPFELDEITDKSVAEVPSIALRVGNASRALEVWLEEYDGFIDKDPIIRVVHSNLGEEAINPLKFKIISTNVDSEWVTFTLGASNPQRKRFPQNRFIKNFCRFRFKSTECGYTGTEYATCNKSLADCRLRNNSVRFGGFPGIGSGGLYI